MRVAFILNPAARNGRASTLEDALLAAGAPHTAQVFRTAGPRHAQALARQAVGSVDRVVAVGGDGTVGEVAAGLAGTGVPMGIVPAGTGNDLAHALGLPVALEEAVAVAVGAEARPMDLLRARWTDTSGATDERVVANALGLGFDAAVAAAVPRYKRLGGIAAYLGAVFATLRDWRRPDRSACVTLDGVEVYDGPLLLLCVGNGSRVGGGFALTPGASAGDGLADTCLVRHISTARALRVLPSAMRGRHTGEPEVSMGTARRVHIQASGRPLPMHGDGEGLASAVAVADLEIVPAAVAVAQSL